MAVAGVLSIWLFSDQTKYQGLIAKHHPGFGDLTFEVGFALAAGLYLVLVRVLKPALGGEPASEADAAPGATVPA